MDKDVAELKTITRESLLEFFDKHICPTSSESRKISVHIQSQKTSVKTYKVNIESLHTCLVSQGVTRLSIEDLRSAVERGEAGEQSLQVILREMLIDETKADEETIEKMMAQVGAAMSDSFVTVDSKKTARRLSVEEASPQSSGQQSPVRDHTRLPEGNILITDPVDFKSRMKLSPAAVPLIDF